MNAAADEQLRDALVRAAQRMPAGQLASLALVVASAERYTPELIGRALTAVASPAYRHHAEEVLKVWALTPDTPGVAVALGLRAASATRDAVHAEQTLEIVWTGPSSHEVPVRQTREALLELIALAQTRLTVVSFAAYRVLDVQHAIAQAAGRGVVVRLVLESAEEAEGRLRQDAADAFAALGRSVTFYVWPKERRALTDGSTGVLHAKAVIADERAAFVTSANLTGNALSRNMELGLLVRGGVVPARLNRHFDQLITQGALRKVT